MSEQTKQKEKIVKEKWYRCHYRVIGVALIVIFILLMIGHIVNYNIINNQKEKSEKIISQILTNAAKEKSLIPDLIVIKNNAIGSEKLLNDSLKVAIVKYISQKYTQKDSMSSPFNISPYILNSEINNEGKILKHIEFLNTTVNQVIEESKNQINTEISKINTWISIWIGVIGFLGIFFPLIINIKSLDEFKELKRTISSLKEKTESMNDNVTAQERIQAKQMEKTKDIENIVQAVKLLSKLKDIDDKFIIYNKNPEEYLSRILQELKEELDYIDFGLNKKVIKNALHQLSYRLYTLSTYSFIQKQIMDIMLELSNNIVDSLENLTAIQYKNLSMEIGGLIEILKKSAKLKTIK